MNLVINEIFVNRTVDIFTVSITFEGLGLLVHKVGKAVTQCQVLTPTDKEAVQSPSAWNQCREHQIKHHGLINIQQLS